MGERWETNEVAEERLSVLALCPSTAPTTHAIRQLAPPASARLE